MILKNVRIFLITLLFLSFFSLGEAKKVEVTITEHPLYKVEDVKNKEPYSREELLQESNGQSMVINNVTPKEVIQSLPLIFYARFELFPTISEVSNQDITILLRSDGSKIAQFKMIAVGNNTEVICIQKAISYASDGTIEHSELLTDTNHLDGNGFLLYLLKQGFEGCWRYGLSLSEDKNSGYFFVNRIRPKESFENAGVEIGDILLSVDGQPLKNLTSIEARDLLGTWDDLFNPKKQHFKIKKKTGEIVELTIERTFIKPTIIRLNKKSPEAVESSGGKL